MPSTTTTTTHSHSDLLSALQKFIRRGMDNDVLAVGRELFARIMATYDVQMWIRLWTRLHIIATEDIGVAQRGTHGYLEGKHVQADAPFYSDNDKAKAQRPLLEAVLTLCRSPKSRLTDNSYMYCARHNTLSNKAHLVYQALEKHNDERRVLQLIASVYRQRHHKKQNSLRVPQLVAALRGYLPEVVSVESESILWAHNNDDCVLYLMHLGLLLCRGLPTHACTPQPINDEEPLPSLTSDLLPDFVYDKHTKRGRELLQRGLHHFVHEGCRLVNCSIADPYYDLLLQEVHEDTHNDKL